MFNKLFNKLANGESELERQVSRQQLMPATAEGVALSANSSPVEVGGQSARASVQPAAEFSQDLHKHSPAKQSAKAAQEPTQEPTQEPIQEPIQEPTYSHAQLPSPSLSPAGTHRQQETAKLSPTLAVVGAKGGVGATTIALNLAAAIALARVNTTLLDAQLQLPTIAHMLGKEPQHSLMELISRRSSLDEQLYRVCSAQLNPSLSLKFLSPPLDGSAGVLTNLSDLNDCLQHIRNYSACWVADVPNQLDRHLVTMLDSATRILLVFEATVAGVAACRRWLTVFSELGYDNDRIICLVNRSGSKFKAVEDQLDTVFGGRSLVRIPNASQLVWQSMTEGVPAVLLQPNHAFSRALVKLANTILASLA